MTQITINLPTPVKVATIRIWFQLDDYLSVELKDAGRNKLAEIEGNAPDFLKAVAHKSGNITFDIDPAAGLIRNWTPFPPEAMEADMPGAGAASTIHLFSKVRDTFSYRFLDAEGNMVVDCQGDYVPGFMPRDHYGDYVDLEIEIATGKILDWTATDDDLQRASESDYARLCWPPKKV